MTMFAANQNRTYWTPSVRIIPADAAVLVVSICVLCLLPLLRVII